MRILITPKSFRNYKNMAYPVLEEKGYEIIENNTGRTLCEDEIIELAKDNVVGIIVGIDPLNERVLTCCKELKAVSKYGAGMDNIDLEAAKKLGIKVKNAVGSNSVSVAEMALSLMLDAAHRVSVMSAKVKAGGWERVKGMELTGKTLAVIGGGQIGKEVAKRAKGLCMEVLIFDPFFSDMEFLHRYGIQLCRSFEQALNWADVVTLHLPLTNDTRHLFNAEAFGKMKPSSILINTARGELVDEESLYSALKSGIIAFAAQDVFSMEPPNPDEKLLKLDNFILTPHAGAFTSEAIEKMVLISTNNLIELLG